MKPFWLRMITMHFGNWLGRRSRPADIVSLSQNGQEAVTLFKGKSAEIRLVILDVAMPLLNGRDAYAKMHGIAPHLPVIFTTGHSPETASLESKIQQGAAFLQKPYDLETLHRALRNTLDTRNS